MNIREALEIFFEKYEKAKSDTLEENFHDIKNKIKNGMAELDYISKNENLKVEVNVGSGNFADVPGIRFYNQDESPSAQEGVYVVYLFRKDLSGVYLTINQGYKRFEENSTSSEARELARKSANELSTKFNDLNEFKFDDNIDLKSQNNIPRGYESTTIAYKFYKSDELPDKEKLEKDLKNALHSYMDYISNINSIQLEKEDFEKIGTEKGNNEVINKLEMIGEKIIEKLPKSFRKDLNCYSTNSSKYGKKGPKKDYLYMYFDIEQTYSRVHPEFLIKTDPCRIFLRLNGEKRNQKFRDFFTENIIKHESKFLKILENLPNFKVKYKRHQEEINSEKVKNVKDELFNKIEEKGITDILISKEFSEKDGIFTPEFIEKASDILRHRLFPFFSFTTKKFSREYLKLLNRDLKSNLDNIAKKELSANLTENELAEINLYFHGEDNEIDKIFYQIIAGLNSGKHIILTGPPGTGKTEVARIICKILCDKYSDLYTGFHLTTATADWSTFDTVGGYMPSKNGGSKLEFNSGQILRRFKDNENQKNDLLIIDEINRADIDKAFGPMFTLLSGQRVQIPFQEDGEEIEIIPYDSIREDETINKRKYVVPKSWRIIATMNSYDKTSLYEMSYAFMRRFQFIRIDVPEIPSPEKNQQEVEDMMEKYLECWDDIKYEKDDEQVQKLVKIWHHTNNAVEVREIGPAIIKDMLGYIQNRGGSKESYTEVIIGYILPQLEGVPEAETIVKNLSKECDDIMDKIMLKDAAKDMLQLSFEEEN